MNTITFGSRDLAALRKIEADAGDVVPWADIGRLLFVLGALDRVDIENEDGDLVEEYLVNERGKLALRIAEETGHTFVTLPMEPDWTEPPHLDLGEPKPEA